MFVLMLIDILEHVHVHRFSSLFTMVETVVAKFPKRLQRVLEARSNRHSSFAATSKLPKDTGDIGSEEEGDGLDWKPVGRGHLKTGLDDAAVLAFEEIDDVDVVFEQYEGGGKVAKLTVCSMTLITSKMLLVHYIAQI